MKLINKTILITAAMAILAVLPTLTASSNTKDVTVLSSQNTVMVNEEVDGTTVAKWIMEAKKLDAKGPANAPIYLVMNTPGGSIIDGLQFVEAMRGLRRPVKTITIFSASMGFQIVQNMGERLILRNGILMSHRAKGGVEGEFGGTEPSQLSSRYKMSLNLIKEMDEQTVYRTHGKQTLESYEGSYANELWLSGTQAVKGGYADRITLASCDNSLSGVTTNHASFMGIPIKYDTSNCPLITGAFNIRMSILTNKGPVDADEFLNKGGQFGPSCLLNSDVNKLCSLDTTLSPEKINELKQKFSNGYIEKQNKVVYMYFDPVK